MERLLILVPYRMLATTQRGATVKHPCEICGKGAYSGTPLCLWCATELEKADDQALLFIWNEVPAILQNAHTGALEISEAGVIHYALPVRKKK